MPLQICYHYLGHMWEVLLTKPQKVQNRAARVITKSEYDNDAGPLINPQGWKNVRELVQADTAVMMFKIMNNMPPLYLYDIFQPLRNVHKINLMDTDTNLWLPRVVTNMVQGSFSYQGVDVWNNLDQKHKTGTSLQSFKGQLQRFDKLSLSDRLRHVENGFDINF